MTPRATYRLQFHKEFGLDRAAEIADYLQALGVSHLYSSPYLQAAPGSMHGYDVVDHRVVNEELGGKAAHQRLTARLRECNLGQVLDIVPNHMAIGSGLNRWWWDVLENGPASIYANYFDIDWQSPEEKLRNKVTVPVLGTHYGRALAAGEITLTREDGSFVFHYFDHRLPASPESSFLILTAAASRARSDYLAFLANTCRLLSTETQERHRDKEVIRGLLGRLCQEDNSICQAIEAELAHVNASPDALDNMLEAQNYRLAYWRTAERELGYRRFFDINTLVGLRTERPEVFRDTHKLVLEWANSGVLDGLRVDHPDGLRDPQQYFEHLHAAAPSAWIVAEKILEPGEALRQDWCVAGTTGYDFLNVLGGLFVHPQGEEALTSFYKEFTGETRPFHEIAIEKKELALRELLGSDVNRLTQMFMGVCEGSREHRDYTRHEIHHAIRAVVVSFPVYRTYVRAEAGVVTQADIECVHTAIEAAKARRPDLDAELLNFLESVLLLRERGPAESEFVMQFQQFTGPAMAKGVEDTAFYSYNRLVSLNEVGGDPSRWGTTVAAFHRYCEQALPDAMLATSTHDTKRSEDVRVRLSQISEIPDRWIAAVTRWSARFDGRLDRNTEYLIYQTMLGAWPLSQPRLMQYMEKAVREAKVNTNWTNPNAEYESTLHAHIESLYSNQIFLQDFEAFVTPLIGPGRLLSLSQTLLKLTARGVPDIYQGTELWDLSLVDPDNRRPVDYAERRKLLAELDHLTPEQIAQRSDEGLPKLWLTRQTLKVRGLLEGYEPIPAPPSAIAYRRGNVLVVAQRFGQAAGRQILELPPGIWLNQLTGQSISGKAPATTALYTVSANRSTIFAITSSPGESHNT